MGKNVYIGVSGVAKKVKNLYIGVNGVARKVKKAWIGVGGVAKECFSAENPAVVLTVGSDYTLGGYTWRCCEVGTKYAVLQSKSTTRGTWPGYKMAKFGGSANTNYNSDIDGSDISDYDETMQSLANAIKPSENASVSYGSGLFLVDSTKCGITDRYSSAAGSGNYYDGLVAAANAATGGGYSYGLWSWTGTNIITIWAYGKTGTSASQSTNGYAVAPAFNLDTTKVTLSGNALTVI